eukprot:gene16877-2906_t
MGPERRRRVTRRRSGLREASDVDAPPKGMTDGTKEGWVSWLVWYPSRKLAERRRLREEAWLAEIHLHPATPEPRGEGGRRIRRGAPKGGAGMWWARPPIARRGLRGRSGQSAHHTPQGEAG